MCILQLQLKTATTDSQRTLYLRHMVTVCRDSACVLYRLVAVDGGGSGHREDQVSYGLMKVSRVRYGLIRVSRARYGLIRVSRTR